MRGVSEKTRKELEDAIGEVGESAKKQAHRQKWILVSIITFLMAGVVAGGAFYYSKNPRVVERVDVQTIYKNQPVFWEQLSEEKQDELMVKGMIFFPEVFSKKYRSKYERFSDWLLEQGATAPTIRDIFSGGGRGTIMFQGHAYDSPQIFLRVEDLLPEIYQTIGTLPKAELKKYWSNAPDGREARIDQWIEMVAVESEEFLAGSDLPVKQILEAGRINP